MKIYHDTELQLDLGSICGTRCIFLCFSEAITEVVLSTHVMQNSICCGFQDEQHFSITFKFQDGGRNSENS